MEGIWRGWRRVVWLLPAGCVALMLMAAGSPDGTFSSGFCHQGDPCMRSGEITGTSRFDTNTLPLPGGGSIDLGPQTNFAVWDSGELEVQAGTVHLAVSPQQRYGVILTVPGGTVTVRDGEVVITAGAENSQVEVLAGTAVATDANWDDSVTVPAGTQAEIGGQQVLRPSRMGPSNNLFAYVDRWWLKGPPWWLVTLIAIAAGTAIVAPVSLLARRRHERRRIRALAAAGLLT